MKVAIVNVGDELLAGDTENTNATWLCARFAARGVDVERVTVVPDVAADVARVVNEYHAEYDAVVVTGGLGPTHDDLTMEAVALAFGRSVEPHGGALAWLEREGGYSADDLAEGTTTLPVDARFIPNDEGVAPGAVVENCYVLPGVPAEMEAMFALIEDEFEGEARFTETVVAAEPESALLDRIAAVQDRFDVTVGSYPGENVRLKLTGADADEVAEAAAWLEARTDVAGAED